MTPDELAEELRLADQEISRLRAVLGSIAANTCCDTCQQAAKVARAALSTEATQGDENG